MFPTGKNDQRQKSKYLAQTLSKCTKKGMDGVDLTDKKATAYHLDAKSTIRFYLRIMFDLMDVAYANSYIVYNMMHPNDLTLIHCKTVVSTYLIGRDTHGSRESPDGKTGSKRSISINLSEVTYHHIFQSFKIFADDVNIATKKKLT